MNNISQKDKSLLIIVLGIAILAVALLFGSKKLQEATNDLEVQNAGINATISKLEELKANQDFYAESIAELEIKNAEIKNAYPSKVLNADEILYVKRIEEAYEMSITNLTMDPSINIEAYYPAAELMDENGTQIEGQSNPNDIYMYKHPINIDFEAGYTDLKRVIQYMVNDNQPKSIESIAVAFNDTSGLLTGSMSASIYSMTGTDVEYIRPDFSGIRTGTDDIFGSFSNASKVNDIEYDENGEEIN